MKEGERKRTENSFESRTKKETAASRSNNSRRKYHFDILGVFFLFKVSDENTMSVTQNLESSVNLNILQIFTGEN